MKWISSDGAPFVLLPNDKLKRWSGVNPSFQGANKDAIQNDFINFGLSDYEQACMLQGDMGILNFEDTIILVFPSEFDVSIIENQYLIRWEYGLQEDLRIDKLKRISDWDFEIMVELSYDSYVIFDSAIPGIEVTEEEMLDLRIKNGFFKISVFRYKPNKKVSMIIYRFKRILIPE